MSSNNAIKNLLDTMRALRDPESGCPWDLEQDFKSITPHTIEEAYEVADAITREDMTDLKDELGDLLFQVVYHAQMASELGLFDFEDIARGINDKMISRHPHVFGDASAQSSEDVNEIWDQQKEKEKSDADQTTQSALDSVALGLPALLRAFKLQKKAARQGFEWTKLDDILAKLDEEVSEFKQAVSKPTKPDDIELELGDILFVMVNIGRHYNINPEEALRKSNNKFHKRFNGIEKELDDRNEVMKDQSHHDLLALWSKQKRA